LHGYKYGEFKKRYTQGVNRNLQAIKPVLFFLARGKTWGNYARLPHYQWISSAC